MDNITHSLVGYAVAKSAKHLKIKGLTGKFKDPKVSSFLVFVSIFAANFPDLDLLYSLFDTSKLGYLLHHRGHTHTFIWALPQALLALVFSALIFKIKDKVVWIWALVLIAINICLHISLDALNIYGVHPFYPWDNNWYFGDRLFIIEPLIWFSILPVLLTPIKRLISFKTLFLVLSLLPLALAVKIQMMTLPTAVLLAFYFLTLGHFFNMMLESSKIITAVSFTVIIILGFMVEGLIVESHLPAQLQTSLAITEPSEPATLITPDDPLSLQQKLEFTQLEDLAITPYPGNPFCWNFYATRILDKDQYQVAIGQYQSRNIWGFKCPQGMDQKKGLDKKALNLIKTVSSITWFSIHNSTLSEVFDTKNDCRLENWFQFIRVPFKTKAGDYIDLRFSSGNEGRNFTKINLTDNDSCVKLPAPWIPPRQNLLEPNKP